MHRIQDKQIPRALELSKDRAERAEIAFSEFVVSV